MFGFGQQRKKAVTIGGAKFKESESFGLFMEGLRSMKLYSEESQKDVPEQKKLVAYLEEALQCLGKCEDYYPNDLLPLYSYGLALTMKNQIVYAKAMLKHGQEFPRGRRDVPRLMWLSGQLELKPGQSSSDFEWTQGPDPARRRSERKPAFVSDEREYLGPLPERPWPLLDHAIDLFDKVKGAGPTTLQTPATFNLAHVYSKRDAEGDMAKAEDLLSGIPKSPQRATTPGEKTESEIDRKAKQEQLATWLQAQTLLGTVRARQELRAMQRHKSEFQPGLAAVALSRARKEIDQAPLPSATKADLDADYWTKAGHVAYEQAFALSPETDPAEFDARLEEAYDYLRRALQIKENWNSAQIYMAQVLQAKGDFTQAERILKVIAAVPPEKSVSAPAPESA